MKKHNHNSHSGLVPILLPLVAVILACSLNLYAEDPPPPPPVHITIPSVDKLHQNDSHWAAKPLDRSKTKTIGDAGCTLTAWTMLINQALAANGILEKVGDVGAVVMSYTPDEINTLLNNHRYKQVTHKKDAAGKYVRPLVVEKEEWKDGWGVTIVGANNDGTGGHPNPNESHTGLDIGAMLLAVTADTKSRSFNGLGLVQDGARQPGLFGSLNYIGSGSVTLDENYQYVLDELKAGRPVVVRTANDKHSVLVTSFHQTGLPGVGWYDIADPYFDYSDPNAHERESLDDYNNKIWDFGTSVFKEGGAPVPYSAPSPYWIDPNYLYDPEMNPDQYGPQWIEPSFPFPGNYLVVDDFGSYENSDALRTVWKDYRVNGSRAEIWLETDPNLTRDGNSMEYMYKNDAWPNYAESNAVTTNLPSEIGSNWTIGGVKALVLYFYGQADNDANEPMYVKLTDGSTPAHTAKVIYNGDMNDVKEPEWHEWNIDLAAFTGVNLADVNRITIGFGDGIAGPGEGLGTVYFEDIRLYTTRCVPGYAPAGDITGDCVVDYEDLEKMARDWLADVFFGLGHTPLGQAQLSVDSNGLVVSNIGSSGEDGVRIALPDNVILWDANIIDLGDPNDPLNPIPDGAFIEVTSRGIVDGIPDSNVSVVRHEDTGAQVTTTVDFSALGPSSLTANYYLNGQLVLTEENIDPFLPPMWFSPWWPNDFAITLLYPCDCHSLYDWYWWRLLHPNQPLPHVITPKGNYVQTDRIDVLVESIAVSFDGYSDVSLTAADMPSFVITDEAVHLSTGAPFTSTDITGDGQVNFRDFAVLANNWLEELLWP